MAPTGKIAMIGDGNVGTALGRGLTRAGYEVRAVGRQPALVKEIAQWGDTVVLAVPYAERLNALREIGEAARGKTLVDVTNAIKEQGRFAGSFEKSGAEEVQGAATGARVVKAFNTVFAQNMDTGQVHGERISTFIAADDAGAKKRVHELAAAIGFDPVDAGPLANARWLEALGMLNIQLGYAVGLGPAIGLRLVREQDPTRARRSEAQRTAR
jgi:predicted dinucleotide-binding enzyme